MTAINDDLVQRIRRDLDDSYDEELELELEDRNVDELAQSSLDTASRQYKESRRRYFRELFRMQGELVKLQDWVVKTGHKVVILFEGRDAAGKGGVIKRITQRLNPRVCRVAALPAPNAREQTQWYFQRYAAHLPGAGEMVLFDRSWYNRAGVEPVMGFCTPEEHEAFMQAVPRFEALLVDSGIRLLKYYLDITRHEQSKRLKARKRDPLKQWKVSPIDEVAVKHWKDYSKARDTMLLRTHTAAAPWRIIHADDKKLARLNLIRDMLSRLDYCDKDEKLVRPDPAIVFEFEPVRIDEGLLAK